MKKYEQKYPYSQKVQVDVNFMKKLMEEFERGKNSTLMLRNIILQHYSFKLEDSYNNKNDYFKVLDHHSIVALDSFGSSISMLKSCDFDSSFVEEEGKLNDHMDHINIISPNQPCKSQVSTTQESSKSNRRRKIGGESKEKEVTNLMDDGFVWRKYGQKKIHDYDHPRHYYRCTHKDEEKCQAKKQIQQISENPIKYKVIYHNNHTCTNNVTPYMINSPEEHSSAIVLSFDGSNLINPMLFPNMNHMKITKTSEEVSSSSNTAISEQSREDYNTTIEVVENNNSLNLDEDYSSFIAEFSELFPDWCSNF
ncbi:hypothetical protein RND81_05G021700 [Saponaria officinalis]|uniref:WRKY domain-containing protein n=1 Tax=Saponaria officinalis TaxID=3572 RepID=A0AAW1KWK6_SAPOF